MKALRWTVILLCLVPLVTGALDMALGARILLTSGVPLSPETATGPILNSQVRFWGAIWFSIGIMLFVAALDLRAHSLWFRLLIGAVLFSGIGRLISIAQFGLPSAPLIAATAIELIGMPVLLWWHWVTLNVRR